MLSSEHPLGRCPRCESISARVREGAYVVCPDCGAGRPTMGSTAGPGLDFPGEVPLPPKETRQELPRPPSREELRLVAPHIRHAMAANIFVVADGRGEGWTGSGIIVAREGKAVAILTNRHMVEDERAHEVPNLRALSLGGEVVPLNLLWRAQGGVDLALVEARFEDQEPIEVMELGEGSCMVGSPLFSIGNPLDLAWTYTSGTLSAIRHWETADKVPVRLIQTDVPTGPGSSGGGLFHQEGHLVGIMSFGKQGSHGDASHFAISVPTIRETVLREQVRWRDRLLVAAVTNA
jgi:S1-C subfamily serine protease